MNTYRPSEFAKLIAKTTKTLQRWDREGILTAHRTPTNRRFYTHDQLSEIMGVKADKRIAVSYCRVSSPGQKDDLLSQQKAVADFCVGAGIAIDETVVEVGGGLNLKRKQFVRIMSLVEARAIHTLVIAHKDRLARFGMDWFEHYLEQHDCKLVIINNEALSPESEMVQDLMAIIDCFSCRLYGLRRYKKIIKEAVSDNPDSL
ncbi:MAG: IS607 family transposase [Methylobacter sp.]|nr:IS607 family transposase [Methylobacter sp.]MDP2426520.1 IS607 family transposase [Methylobacter sp.]MDP3056213.1 IS607 family transposase [Methylobacter sp.]MDP3361491.1 IS607 family transposase [Methylobacter sp.]MDZ4221224.1 IS607 family transposase [Methylobacter sp.]